MSDIALTPDGIADPLVIIKHSGGVVVSDEASREQLVAIIAKLGRLWMDDRNRPSRPVGD